MEDGHKPVAGERMYVRVPEIPVVAHKRPTDDPRPGMERRGQVGGETCGGLLAMVRRGGQRRSGADTLAPCPDDRGQLAGHVAGLAVAPDGTTCSSRRAG